MNVAIEKINNYFKNFSLKDFWMIIIILIVFRFVLILLLINNNLAAGFDNKTFSVGFGGDESAYFFVAKNLSDFKIEELPSQTTIGLPMYLTPFVCFLGSDSFKDRKLNKYTFIALTFLWYPLSIILVSLGAFLFFKNYLKGIIAGVVYVAYPMVLYLLNIGPYGNNFTNFFNAIWTRGLISDGFSAFFVYLLFYCYLKNRKEKSSIKYLLLGIVAGAASLIRVTNLIFIPVVGLLLIYSKKFKELILFGLSAFASFIPQLIYNLYAHGRFLSFGGFDPVNQSGMMKDDYYLFVTGTIAKLGFTPQNYYYFLSVFDKYIPFFALILILAVVFFVLAFWFIYKNYSRHNFILMLLWVIPFSLFYASFHTSAREVRYWLPIIPQIIILFISGIYAIPYFVKYGYFSRTK